MVARLPTQSNPYPQINLRAFPKWNACPEVRHFALAKRFLTHTPAHIPLSLSYTEGTMTFSRSALGLCLLPCLTLPLPAQTSSATPHHATPTHHAASTSNTADHPPGVPPVRGLPKPLFALRYIDVLVGTGPIAEPRKFYTVRYTGWTTDGKKFDSSDDHPGQEPYTFAYGAHRVIIGWDTGFQGMHVGGKRRLFVPYQLAYGEAGRPPIPPKADLIFDLELVSQSDTPPAPPTPPAAKPDPAAPGTPPPASATPTSPQPGANPTPTAPPSGQPTDPTKPTTSPSH